MQLLYLASAPYSGSTLTSLLLASHRDIATVGELSGPDPNIKKEEHLCSCGVPNAICPFWFEMRRRLVDKGVSYAIMDQKKGWRCSENRYVENALTRAVGLSFVDRIQGFLLRRLWPFADRVGPFLERNVAVMREITDYCGASLFLDSSKSIDRLQILRRSVELDIRVLHLVRDGRGQTFSHMRRGRDMTSAARSLVRFDAQAALLKRLVGSERYLLARYEDICRDPKKELGCVAEFAGLDPDGFAERFQVSDPHTLGNPMQYEYKGQIELDERWRTGMREEDLAVFNRLARERNRRFGYED